MEEENTIAMVGWPAICHIHLGGFSLFLLCPKNEVENSNVFIFKAHFLVETNFCLRIIRIIFFCKIACFIMEIDHS